MKKLKEFYKKANKRSEWFEPLFIIAISLIFTLGLFVTVQSVMGGTSEITIATNKAEEYFYEGKYDEAINEYLQLQKEDEWPQWKVKIAEIYSVKGDYDKSNTELKEAIIIKDKLMEKDPTKYADLDKELTNNVVFTFFMNKQYEEALSLGEDYLLNVDKYKPLMRTMFTIYMVNGEASKAKEIVSDYVPKEDSSYDTAVLAKMQLMLDDSDKGYDTLKKAFEMNNDEVKVFDVISQLAAYDRDGVLSKLKELSEKNPSENSYKLWIAKVYSMIPENAKDAEEILSSLKEEFGNTINYKIMQAQVYKNTGKVKDSEKIIESIIDSKEKSYIGYHVAAWQYYEEEKYEKAFEYCKKSILENKNYPDNYGFLVPEIMIGWGQPQAVESYFRTALAKEPFNFNIMVKIADYYAYSATNYEKANEYYNLALSIKPKEAELYYNLGSISLLMDDKEKAIENFQKAIEINQNNGKYYRSLGTVYLIDGEHEKAIENIRQAYTLDETDVLALNNAACYYISIEGDIWRGYENMEAAYNDMPASLDNDSKNIITDNYAKAKKLFDKFVNEEGVELTIPEFQLFY